MEEEDKPLKHLFQQEFSKMVAVISKQFGLQHIEIAEDIVAETFLTATETWKSKGLPVNPTAWLYTVAKNKTYHHFKRDKIFDGKIAPQLKAAKTESVKEPEVNFSDENIRDSQLQMMFAVCNPLIASEAQIGLALRVLCGFGIDEIAEAFLTNKETINKRLFRAKEKLRIEKVKMELPGDNEITHRLDNVLRIIYLLFNEGYYSTTQNLVIRKDLCLEALRLGILLTEFDKTNLPKTNALIALMCFHSSRVEARQENNDSPVLYEQQDRELWDKDLIHRGNYFLTLSVQGNEITSYHYEAQIAYWHSQQEDTQEKWENILQLYNQLLQINYSPGVALNRTFALYKARGAKIALIEAEKLNLESNHFYFTLLGELYKNIDLAKARANFQKAFSLAKTNAEKQNIQAKIVALNNISC